MITLPGIIIIPAHNSRGHLYHSTVGLRVIQKKKKRKQKKKKKKRRISPALNALFRSAHDLSLGLFFFITLKPRIER